jgi:Tfp pilus assembly protein PilN
MKDDRVETVASLAQSRFDWERVMNEVARVLPDSVWLTNLTGTVSPEVTVPDAAGSAMRAGVEGPALTMIGCARSQQDVAALIAAVGDIDGVSRVLVEKSEKAGSDASTDADGVNINEDCRTRSYVAKFALIAAFDGVAAGDAATAATVTAPAADSATAVSSTVPAPATTDPSTTVPEEAQAKANVDAGIDKAQNAAGLVGAEGGG